MASVVAWFNAIEHTRDSQRDSLDIPDQQRICSHDLESASTRITNHSRAVSSWAQRRRVPSGARAGCLRPCGCAPRGHQRERTSRRESSIENTTREQKHPREEAQLRHHDEKLSFRPSQGHPPTQGRAGSRATARSKTILNHGMSPSSVALSKPRLRGSSRWGYTTSASGLQVPSRGKRQLTV